MQTVSKNSPPNKLVTYYNFTRILIIHTTTSIVSGYFVITNPNPNKEKTKSAVS